MGRWFSRDIQDWYEKNKRDLPWRNESDPYKIWLSEIILQQTQVKQGLSYYLKFTGNYPTVKHLARATEDKVMKDWQGLGYYTRARNLHLTAKSIVENHKGLFPQNYDEITKLKGIGEYTASAIASFAFNAPHAVVDGNVFRLLSRVFGISKPIDSSEGKKTFRDLATRLMDIKNPARYNQAIMEFGSQFCKPANPDCENCIFKLKCQAYKIDAVSEFPVKSKKIKVSKRYFNYLVLVDKNKNIALNKRNGKDIWKGLYDFNLIECDSEIEHARLFEMKEVKTIAGNKFKLIHLSKLYQHVLTHQKLYCRFYVIKVNFTFSKSQISCKSGKLSQFAFPRLIEKFLDDCFLDDLF